MVNSCNQLLCQVLLPIAMLYIAIHINSKTISIFNNFTACLFSRLWNDGIFHENKKKQLTQPKSVYAYRVFNHININEICFSHLLQMHSDLAKDLLRHKGLYKAIFTYHIRWTKRENEIRAEKMRHRFGEIDLPTTSFWQKEN